MKRFEERPSPMVPEDRWGHIAVELNTVRGVIVRRVEVLDGIAPRRSIMIIEYLESKFSVCISIRL